MNKKINKIILYFILFSNIVFSQNFNFKSDTIKTKYIGSIKNCIKHKSNLYFFTETSNSGFSSKGTLHFYKINKKGNSLKIVVPKELQQFYIDLYSKKDTVFAVEYWNKNTYFLDLKKNEWVKTIKSKDIIYEDENYVINSIDLGEFGGYTWFKNKLTNKEYGFQAFVPMINKINNKFLLIKPQALYQIGSLENLQKAIMPYEKYNKECAGKIINSGYNSKNVQVIYENKNYYEPEIVFYTSYISKNNLLQIYTRKHKTYIGKIINNKFKDLYKFENGLQIFRYHFDYRNQINNDKQTIQFSTKDEYLNGLIEINNNQVQINYIENLNKSVILSTEQYFNWFKDSFQEYLTNFKKITTKDIKNTEEKVFSRDMDLWYKDFKAFRVKEVDDIILTTEYKLIKDTKSLKEIRYSWDLHWKIRNNNLDKKFNKKPITTEFTNKGKSIKDYLFRMLGKTKDEIDSESQSYIWNVNDRKIELYISNVRIALKIE